MHTRFLAAAGPPILLDSLCGRRRWPDALPPPWKVLLRHERLIVLVRGDAPSLLFPSGAVLGSLFHRQDSQPINEPTPRLGDDILDTRGQCLVDSRWGAWFAVFADGNGHWALRDPSGFLPIHFRSLGGVSFYFTDIEAAIELDPVNEMPDPEFLRHWLAFPHLRTAGTGVRGVTELLPGTRRTVANGQESVTAVWSPWTFAAEGEEIADFDEAATRVREEVVRTVPAQARGRGRLLLELSGGLDSSIIAASLKAGDVPFRSVNFVTRTAEGDERRYARAVADGRSDCHDEIREMEWPLELGLPERRMLRPGLSPVVAPLHRHFAAHGDEVGAETSLTGAGGDNVFCFLTTAAPVLDAWRRLGPKAALTTALADVSALCTCTSWTTARFALRKAAREWRGPQRWLRETDFLPAGNVPKEAESHPWLELPRGALPGKREHVTALMRIQHTIDPEISLSDRPTLHPLIAQPLVELCLRIPTWLWVRGGRNRAVARQAFRGLLPDPVLDRRGKGRLESMCIRAYQRSRTDIAELLLGGALREGGLVDPDALESYLEVETAPSDSRYFRLFELLSAELWLRSWRR